MKRMKISDTSSNVFKVAKLMEELNELNTALIEMFTKGTDIDAVIEEMGDVEARMEEVKNIFDIQELVEKRKKYKLGRIKRIRELKKLKNDV